MSNTSPDATSRREFRCATQFAVAWFVFSVLTVSLAAGQDCPVPPAIQPVARELNIFADQQEVDLGDVMAESLARQINIIDDDKQKYSVDRKSTRLNSSH